MIITKSKKKILDEVFHFDEAFKTVVFEELEVGKGLISSENRSGTRDKELYLILTDHGRNFVDLVSNK